MREKKKKTKRKRRQKWTGIEKKRKREGRKGLGRWNEKLEGREKVKKGKWSEAKWRGVEGSGGGKR